MQTLLTILSSQRLSVKRTLIACSFLFVLSSLMSAQVASNPNLIILPYGSWQLCESASGSQLPICNGFTAGNEQFVLLIRASNAQTTKYLITVVATMQDGSSRVFSCKAPREENGYGYTPVTLYFGGVGVAFATTVEEVIGAAVQTGSGTFQP
jgi:hypothetical protein